MRSTVLLSKPAKTTSLFRYLAIVVLVCIVMPAIVSGWALIYANFKRTIELDSHSSANGFADVLEAGMSVPLWNLSPDLGHPIVENLFVDSSILSVVVTTDTGEKFMEFARSDKNSKAGSIEVAREVSYGGNVIGSVSLKYSLSKAHVQAVNEAKLLAVIIGLQLVISLAVISFLVYRRVLAPIRKLDAAAAGIAQGDLRTTIPYLSNDELGSLGMRLEKMRSVLEENFNELEVRVETRTAQVQSVNKTLQGTLDELEHARDNLFESEKLAALGALVAGVAHELNTPIGNGLTVISALCDKCEEFNKSLSHGLRRATLDKFNRDIKDGTKLVCRNLEKASELISSFKQVAVDRTSAHRRQFKLREFIDETLLTVSPMFKRTPFKVRIDMAGDITLDSYPGPLGQVITNLLSNAIIHGFDGCNDGLIIVSIEAVGDLVEVHVKDDGNGIAAEHQAKIFNPFFTTKLGEGGNGLGMHIVHNIVTGVLGGSIVLDSTLGQGTTFRLCLPIKAPEETGIDLPPMRLGEGKRLAG